MVFKLPIRSKIYLFAATIGFRAQRGHGQPFCRISSDEDRCIQAQVVVQKELTSPNKVRGRKAGQNKENTIAKEDEEKQSGTTAKRPRLADPRTKPMLQAENAELKARVAELELRHAWEEKMVDRQVKEYYRVEGELRKAKEENTKLSDKYNLLADNYQKLYRITQAQFAPPPPSS
ncbi:hypothetical protein JCM5353_006132 [Sporobolomyces roseus]